MTQLERGIRRMKLHIGQADIERVCRMERAFDRLREALNGGALDGAARENARLLEAYLASGQWLADYALDERGQWPGNLKRGVLSQDALYDLLRRIDEEGEQA